MQLSAAAKAQKTCARAKAALRSERGIDAGIRRAREIAALDSKLWRGRRVWPILCTGTSGKGPHEMYVETAALWSLIDLHSFRCPYHANAPRRNRTLKQEGP